MTTDSMIPELAVIIPARNEATRLGRCLDSVRHALDYAGVTHAEVVVVDDDSTDGTSEIARSHGARVLRQARRRGPLAAWSRGADSTAAPLLIFVDADCRVAASSLAVILGGFARSSVGVVAARSLPDSQRIGRTVAERSAVFSARMLHETKVRLVNHDFLPIGRLMAVRRAAWQAGADHRWPCDRIVAGRAKRAGWEIVYLPEATVYYEPVRTYEGLRADYLRTTIGQARLNGEWSEPLPPRIVRRAASASLRRDLLNGAAWLAVRMRLWGEQATGRMRLEDAYAQWDRLGSESQ